MSMLNELAGSMDTLKEQSVAKMDPFDEKLEEEMKEVETKHKECVELIPQKSEEIQKLKESALVTLGAKSMLAKIINSRPKK